MPRTKHTPSPLWVVVTALAVLAVTAGTGTAIGKTLLRGAELSANLIVAQESASDASSAGQGARSSSGAMASSDSSALPPPPLPPAFSTSSASAQRMIAQIPAPVAGDAMASGCYDALGRWTENYAQCDWVNQRLHFENARIPSSSRITRKETRTDEEIEKMIDNRFVEYKRAELLGAITQSQQRLVSLLAANILPAQILPDVRAVNDWLSKMYDYYLVQQATLEDLQEAGNTVYASLEQIQIATESMRADQMQEADPRLEHIITRLTTIINTVPTIVAIFQREHLPVSFDTLNAYVQAEDLLQRTARAGCPAKQDACTGLKDVIDKLQIASDAIQLTLDERGTDALRREVEALN